MSSASTTFPDLHISMEDDEEVLKFLGEVSQHDMEVYQQEMKEKAIRDAKEKERLRHEKEKRQREEQRRKEEDQRLREEQRAAQLAALPPKLRAFVDAGGSHGLTIDERGNIGGAYRFIWLPHIDENSFGIGEPRPEGLPWIRKSLGLWVAMLKDDIPGGRKASQIQAKDFGSVGDAVWPTDLARDAYDAFDEFLSERKAWRLRKPNFFAPDLYDANCEEPYLVDGMLPDTGISLFAGDWDSGKTILLVDLAAHIASGLPWLNRSVSPRPVVYYALEAGYDVSKRLCATNEKLNSCEKAPTGAGTVPVRLENVIPHDYEGWREQIGRLDSEICDRVRQRCVDQGLELPEEYLVHPPVVIVDTLRQACGHKSRGPEVEEFYSKVDRLVRDGAASHVIIAHHTTKTGNEYAGDDFLVSDSTSLYYVRRPNHNKPMFQLVCDRVKGISKPPAANLMFKVVEVGNQQTVVLVGENSADPKLLEIASGLPARIDAKKLREFLEPHLTGETDGARYKSFQRLRDKLLEAGLIVAEGAEYLRST